MRNAITSLLTFAVLWAAISFWQTRSLPRGVAPILTGANLQSGISENFPTTQDGVEILYFFAPWCGVCKLSSKNAETVASWISGAHVTFVSLDYESKSDVEHFVVDNGLSSKVLLGDRSVQAAWQIEAYPTYAIVRGDGHISSVSVGYSTTLGMAVRVVLARLGV